MEGILTTVINTLTALSQEVVLVWDDYHLITALDTRTEGWIAGLQLAALSLHGHTDIPGFIRAFTGSHRYVVDYLVEEVLVHQPEPVQTFLLQTAILERMTGSLCEAVTGNAEGQATLERLEQANLFLVPLSPSLRGHVTAARAEEDA
jgi:ATP/maltotriose-dependent transcriptional regulator MalT